MLKWLRSLSAWNEVRCTGVHSYQVNEVTGARRILKLSYGVYQPVDAGWLKTGCWTDIGPPPFGVVAHDA